MSSEPGGRREAGLSLISLGHFFLCTISVIALGVRPRCCAMGVD